MGELPSYRCSDLRHRLRCTKPIKPRHKRCVQACGYSQGRKRNLCGDVCGSAFAPGLQYRFGHFLHEQREAIVGEEGELEHAAAILHPKLGKPFRAAVEKGASLIPSAKKMGGPGTAIDVPLGHKDAAFVRSHFDAMEVRVPDAPRRGEIVVALVVTDSGRPRPRVGGLTKDQIEGKDGLR
jgi:hypothetical protein